MKISSSRYMRRTWEDGTQSNFQVISPTASLKNSTKIQINLLKFRKNQKKEKKIRKSIGERKYSILQTIGGKECSGVQTMLLEVIGGRKYGKLETVGGKKYSRLQIILLHIIGGRKYSKLQTIGGKEYNVLQTTYSLCTLQKNYQRKGVQCTVDNI